MKTKYQLQKILRKTEKNSKTNKNLKKIDSQKEKGSIKEKKNKRKENTYVTRKEKQNLRQK